MYAVLRRSTTAEKIADSVDAAMSKQPGEGDDGWMATLSEPTDALKDAMTKESKRHHYAGAHAPIRVLPAEGWARVLPDAVQKGSGKTLFAMVGGSLVDQYQAVADLKKQIGDLKGKYQDNKIEMKKDGESDDDKNRLSKENDDPLAGRQARGEGRPADGQAHRRGPRQRRQGAARQRRDQGRRRGRAPASGHRRREDLERLGAHRLSPRHPGAAEHPQGHRHQLHPGVHRGQDGQDRRHVQDSTRR